MTPEMKSKVGFEFLASMAALPLAYSFGYSSMWLVTNFTKFNQT